MKSLHLGLSFAIAGLLCFGTMAPAVPIDLGAIGLNWDFEEPDLIKEGDIEVWASQGTQLGVATFGDGWNVTASDGDFGIQDPMSTYFGAQNPLPAPFNGNQIGYFNIDGVGADGDGEMNSLDVVTLQAGQVFTLKVAVSARFTAVSEVQYDIGLQASDGTDLGTFATTTVTAAEATVKDLTYTLNVNSQAAAFVGQNAQIVIRTTDINTAAGSQSAFDNVRLDIAGPVGPPPGILTLEVDPANGQTRIRNTTSQPINLDFFEITSAASALDEASWSPLDDGVNDGVEWDVLGNLNDSILAQFYLDGHQTLAGGGTLPLGAAFDGPAQDLAFRFHDPVTDLTRTGFVTYGPITGQPGDFDLDTDVDGNDFLVWQRGLGTTHTAGDLAIWKANFGAGGATGAVGAVPEPSSLVLLAAAVGGLTFSIRNRKQGASAIARPDGRIVSASAALVVAASLAATATAAVTIDRDFRFGEGVVPINEGGVAGAIVGSGHGTPAAGDTIDGQGPSGAFLGLNESGSPVYLNVFSGPKARAGTAAGALGVQFDGVDDLLSGIPLNRPDELATLIGGSYPLNYTGITARGLQGWVYPDQAGLTAGAFQSVISDTVLSGGPAITADGKWTQINSGHITDIPGTVSVVGNAWHHVMHHNYPRGGDNFRSVLYVNGIAVSASDDGITIGGTTTRVDQLVVGAAELDGDGGSPVYGHFFRGAVDDLEMYVVGNNTAQGGQNYGTFDLFADNDWIANRIVTTVPGGVLTPGDVNRDGSVNGNGTGPVGTDDVSAFIAGWRDRKNFQGAHNALTAGDWETWGWGDMDHDGIVGFSDWFLLRANHPTAATLNLGALLGAVPEPSSAMLSGLALLGAGLVRKRSA